MEGGRCDVAFATGLLRPGWAGCDAALAAGLAQPAIVRARGGLECESAACIPLRHLTHAWYQAANAVVAFGYRACPFFANPQRTDPGLWRFRWRGPLTEAGPATETATNRGKPPLFHDQSSP